MAVSVRKTIMTKPSSRLEELLNHLQETLACLCKRTPPILEYIMTILLTIVGFSLSTYGLIKLVISLFFNHP
jgi:hypothetical protein